MASTESLNELTVDQLKQLANDNNVETNSKMKKDELVTAVAPAVSQEDVDALTTDDDSTDDQAPENDLATVNAAPQEPVERNASDESEVKARPQGEGIDPLSRGERLYNDENTEAAKTYSSNDAELKAESTADDEREQLIAEREARASDSFNKQDTTTHTTQSLDDQAPDSINGAPDKSDRGTGELQAPTGANREAAVHNAEAPSDLTKDASLDAAKSPSDPATK